MRSRTRVSPVPGARARSRRVSGASRGGRRRHPGALPDSAAAPDGVRQLHARGVPHRRPRLRGGVLVAAPPTVDGRGGRRGRGGRAHVSRRARIVGDRRAMIPLSVSALLVAYVPGALLYRLPVARRARRAALDVEERAFWHVILSLAWSLGLVLAMA